MWPTTSHPELPTASGAINGSVTAHVEGQLRAYFKMVYLDNGQEVAPPANSLRPDHLFLVVGTWVAANAWLYGNPLELLSGSLLANASASDSFGETVTVYGALSPNNHRTSPLSAGGLHLVSAKVQPNGVAEVYLNGSLDAVAVNSVNYDLFGGAMASTEAEIDSAVRPVNAQIHAWSTACAPTLCGDHPDPATGWTPSAPRYFSGTGCEADALAVPASGYLTHAQLCIADSGNDQVVKEYWDANASGCPRPAPTDGSVTVDVDEYSQPLKALFDSTHFKDSTMIVLKLKVWDSNSGYYEGKIQGPAYNKALVLGNNTFGASATQSTSDVSNVVKAINYFAFSSTQLHSQVILQVLPGFTVLYIDSHGNVGQIDDCFATGVNAKTDGQGDPIPGTGDSGDNYMGSVQIEMSTGKKNLFEPPNNLIFLDACNTVGNKLDNPGTLNDVALSGAFGIPLPGTNSDRALLGFNWYTNPTSDNANWTKRVWDWLAIGVPLYEAVNLSTEDGGVTGPASNPGGYFYYGSKVVNPVIQGDNAFTLHNIYSGPFAAWFRPL